VHACDNEGHALNRKMNLFDSAAPCTVLAKASKQAMTWSNLATWGPRMKKEAFICEQAAEMSANPIHHVLEFHCNASLLTNNSVFGHSSFEKVLPSDCFLIWD